MPQRKFRMILSSKNVQTTAYPRFRATQQTNPNFIMNAGCCGNRNPLKGWRKEIHCCEPCPCEQTFSGDVTGTTPTPGDTYTATAYSATGVVVSSTYAGGGNYNIVVTLNDCHKPLAATDTLTFSSGGIITNGSAGGIVSKCNCICTQIIDLGATLSDASGRVHVLAFSGTNTASGVIIGTGPGLNDIVVLLDDCDTPFTSSDNGDIVVTPPVGGSMTFTGSIVNENVTKNCTATPSSSKNVIGWQQVFKNVDGPACCKLRTRMIQNRAGSSAAQTAANGGVAYRVSGKIDRNYNHNYRQYLKKRCKLPYYDLKGGSTSFVFEPRFGTSVHVGSKRCCTDDCRDFHTGISPNGTPNQPATYKRNNWTFRRQGAVDNDIYIMKKTYQGLNTCPCPPCVCEQLIRGSWNAGHPVATDLGITVTGNNSHATGVITAVTGDDGGIGTVTIDPDDCDTPFNGDSALTAQILGITVTIMNLITSISVVDAIKCGDPPVQRRDPPQYPQNNPKNYNKRGTRD